MRRRFLPLLVVVAAAGFLAGGAGAAWALSRSGPGAAKAKTLAVGSQPTASVQGHKVTVTWTATSFTTGGAAPGYVIRRYNVATGVGVGAANGCSGTLTVLTCTETGVVAGSWQYTVTPAAGTNWRGPESPKSAVVVV
jgi:hypothetical protein